MNVLITNDDGIQADGLAALSRAVKHAFPHAHVFTVAPSEPMSLVGHRVTTHAPLAVTEAGPDAWAVAGTPADCVRVALKQILPKRPDWVFSGVNHGGNMGQDVYISGTVAAVREAAYHGFRGVAFSQYLKRGLPLDWEIIGRRAGGMLQKLLQLQLDDGAFWNVNFPHLAAGDPEPEARQAELERGPLPVSYEETEGGLLYQGAYGDRPRADGSDVDVCFRGQISISKLCI